MGTEQDNSEAAMYVKSLRDVVKRRFATEYLEWIRGGRTGGMPGRGALSPSLAKAVGLNLDALN